MTCLSLAAPSLVAVATSYTVPFSVVILSLSYILSGAMIGERLLHFLDGS
jgi:hypothetical protein